MRKPIAVLLLAVAVPAAAQTQTQTQMNAEAATAYRRADAALNAQYRATMAVLRRGGGSAAVLAAQRAWLGYRDAECAVARRAFAGGTAEGMALNQCLATLTRQRTERLRFAADDADR